VLSTDVLYLYVITLRDGKHKKKNKYRDGILLIIFKISVYFAQISGCAAKNFNFFFTNYFDLLHYFL